MPLVPGWTGFNIEVRDNMVVSESAIGYLSTLDSPATDLKAAYEVLPRGCKVIDRLQRVRSYNSVCRCGSDYGSALRFASSQGPRQKAFNGFVIR